MIMKKYVGFLSAVAAAVCLIVAPMARSAAEITDYDSEIATTVDRIAEELSASSLSGLSEKIADGAGISTDWYAIALSRAHFGIDLSAYAEKLEKRLSDGEIEGAVAIQRVSLALIFSGRPEKVGDAVDRTAGRQGIMSLVFALHLINNGAGSEAYTASDLLDEILGAALPSGGWAVIGTNPDVDTTAMVMQAIAPHRENRSDVSDAIDKAAAFLSARQLENGGFASFGKENCESLAQVMIALHAIGVDPDSSDSFLPMTDRLLSYRTADGGFAHFPDGASNKTATVQALCALVSAKLFHTDGGTFYMYEDGAPEPPPVTDDRVTTKAPTTVRQPTTEKAPTVTDGGKTDSGHKVPIYKLVVGVSVALLAAAVCLILYVKGKRGPKHILPVILAAALIIAATAFTDIRSPGGYYSETDAAEKGFGTVRISIRCDVIADSGDDIVPKDGVIIKDMAIDIHEGESVLDLLVEAAKRGKIQFDEKSGYVSSIAFIRDHVYGDLSGWVYFVNGVMPSVGCDEFVLSDGDLVEWHYTLDFGRDVSRVYADDGGGTQ